VSPFRWVLILIMLIAMLFLWKHALCYWVDLGNMILIVYIMVVQIIILSCLKAKK
jgi:membrane protein YdbS with pleckstrin-like domain